MEKGNRNGKNGPQKQGTDGNNFLKPKNTRRVPKRNFSISLTGKHVYGAYFNNFNMARTNFVKTINYSDDIAVGTRR